MRRAEGQKGKESRPDGSHARIMYPRSSVVIAGERTVVAPEIPELRVSVRLTGLH